MKTQKRTLEQIEKELEEAQIAYDMKFYEDNEDNAQRPWEEFLKYAEPELKKIGKLSREKRMMMPYKLEEIPEYGDVMSLKDFIGCVNEGGFIDYDGYGHYAKDNMMSDIIIRPSDVKHKSIRKDFDTIVWFNR
jgi:hypothetical protein